MIGILLLLLFPLILVTGVVVGEKMRGRPGLGILLSLILFVLCICFSIEETNFVSFASGYLLYIVLGLQILFILPDKRQKCPHCKSVIKESAKICHACANPLPSESEPQSESVEKTIPCPYCGKKLEIILLKRGKNKCLFCGKIFECR